MENEMKIILNMFDIRKLKLRCNEPNCENKPKKEVLIYEQTIRRGKKNLASLYLCNHHLNRPNELIKKLKEFCPTIVISAEVKDLK